MPRDRRRAAPAWRGRAPGIRPAGQNHTLDPVRIDDVIGDLDALHEDLGDEPQHQQGESAMVTERVDRRLAIGILGRKAAEEMAHARALFQHHAPTDQDHAHPLDQMPGLVNRGVMLKSSAPEQDGDLDERERQRQRDQHIERKDRPAVEK
jgi:hypothetical protein